MLRHESLRACISLTWDGNVKFEQAVLGYTPAQLNAMDKTVKAHPETFKFGIPYPWQNPFKGLLDAKDEGALLLDDLAKRLEGDEPIKP